MKLNELFLTPDQLKLKQLRTPIAKKHAELNKSSTTRKRIGSGVYADVLGSESDPGSVDKIAKPEFTKSLSRDPYYQFLDQLAHDRQFMSNPYFPKVFDLKTFRGSDGKLTYKVNMEKLSPLKTLRMEEIFSIGRRVFGGFDDAFNKAVKHFTSRGVLKHGTVTGDFTPVHRDASTAKPEYDQRQSSNNNEQEMLHSIALDTLADMFDSALSRYNSVDVKDSKLTQAMQMLHKVLGISSSFSPDIHRDNIMVRRGPFAPQIVITDPISGQTETEALD